MGFAVALFLVTSAVVFGALLSFYRSIKKTNPHLRFQFRVVDIWASVIGIAPSTYMLVKLFESGSYNEHEILLWAGCIGLPVQVGGCVFGVLTNEIEGESSRERPLHAAINILGGAIVSLGLIPLVGVAWAVIFSIIYYYSWTSLAVGLATIILVVYGFGKLSNHFALKSKTSENPTPAAPFPSSPPASPSDGPLGG